MSHTTLNNSTILVTIGGHGVCSTSPSLGGKTNTKFCGFHFNVLSAVKVNSPVCGK